MRFGLELAALAALGYWGWTAASGFWRFVLALLLPLLAATLWGTLRAPGDASHGGGTPLAVPGPLRLGLELFFFAAAAWGLFAAGRMSWALTLGGLVILHYGLSYDRVRWLFRGPST